MSLKTPIEGINSVTVINPESGEILKDYDIKIKNNRIIAIDPSKKIQDSKGIDGSNLYAIPGLIDSHVHALGFMHEEVPNLFDLKWVLNQQRRNLKAYIQGGVTTVRDMASALKLIKKISQKANDYEIEAPRMVYVGPMFTVKGGYPYFVEKTPRIVEWIAGPLRIDLNNVGGESKARKIVDKVVAAGASCIKIGFQSVKYDDEQSEIPCISIPLLRTVVEQGHKHNLPVAVHCCYRKDFQKLLDAPDIRFDSLEHLTIDEPLNNDEVKRFAERNIPISTTLMTYGIIDHVDKLELLLEEEPERFEKKPLEFLKQSCLNLRSGAEVSRFIGRKCVDIGSKYMRENLKKLKAEGVKIVCATDSGGAITPPGCLYWELIDMIRAGMTPLEALRTATSIAADVIGIPDLGRLSVGKIADIVLLKKNPLENFDVLKEIVAVIREGNLIHQINKKKK